ncbi:RBR-type E3 ubiquitin transferase, partial [Sarracenia purpurea var. burkii]
MGRGRRGRQGYSYPIDERWEVRPLHYQNQETVNTNQQADFENSSSSMAPSDPSTIVPISEFIAKTSKPPLNHRNPKRVSRNWRGHASKPRFVRVDPPSSSTEENGKEGEADVDSNGDMNELGSSRSSKEDKVGEEEEEENGGGKAPGSENDSNGERIEGPDSIKGVDYIGRRLEELQVGAEEPELSEEQLRINDQLQEDELLAMESIYGDNLFILGKWRGLRFFQIHVHVDAPSELTITAKLASYRDLEAKTDSLDEFSYSFKVQHLPPIVLTCILPKSYPSHLSPYFTVSVQWLESEKISRLCSMLDSVWKEQPGQEVIFRWVEWLQCSSLSHINFDKEIVLGPYGLRYAGDRRAISESISPDVDIPSLKSYNDEQHHENFCRNFHECCICFSEFA